MRLNVIGANQTEVHFKNGIVVFFSYNTPVAAFVPEGPTGFVRTEERYSVTTSKHINKWLDGAKATEVPQSYLDNLVGNI